MPRDLFGDMAEASMAFLREMCPQEGYVLAFSGGKDSVVIYDLAERAEVPFHAVYSITSVDPPELVWFIKREYPQVERRPPAKSMWRLIETSGLPTRTARFCCKHLKERVIRNATVITGIRADESAARRTRGPVEQHRKFQDVRFVHAILSWRSCDVWGYIRERSLPYCELYDQGFKRLGCVLCPFNREVAAAQRRWPKLFAAGLRAVKRGWPTSAYTAARARWDSPEAMWEWWLARDEPYPEPQRTCGGLFV